jgi:hypothetical protein
MSNVRAEDELPSDPGAFYSAGTRLEELPVPDLSVHPSALERLGPSPFPRSGFPFIGFLATLYDQVSGTGQS